MENRYFTPPKGLICPIISPLKEDRSFDSVSFERLLRHVAPSVDGLLLGEPVWGEGLFLPLEIRLDLITCALNFIKGHPPVFITITGETPEKTASLMNEARQIITRSNYVGKIFWVDYPLFYHSNRGLPEFYAALLPESRIPLVIGNHPEIVKFRKSAVRRKNIRTKVLKKVVQNRAIVGMIFIGDLKRSYNYHSAVRTRTDFVFYDGDESVFLRHPGTGGIVAGGSNLVPRNWQNVVRTCLHQYESERHYPFNRATTWEWGTMLRSLHSLCVQSPAAHMKKMLRDIGIIASGQTASNRASEDAEWQKDLEKFFSAYDIL
jgi:dihydrodipicolinate synthase/N-acetylneuraminate lyase